MKQTSDLIKRSLQRPPLSKSRPPLATPRIDTQDIEETHKPFSIVGIGASAGGLEAFQDLLQSLSPKTGMAFVLIQHLDPKHESMLASIHARTTQMRVLEAKNKMTVEPNHVYIIPPNASMSIQDGMLKLQPRAQGVKLNLPIDDFFEALANDWGSQAIGVILSGSASDGSRGIMMIKDVGGITFAQDGQTAQFEMMPRNAVLTDCIDFVLSPTAIAHKLNEIAMHPYLSPSGPKSKELLAEEVPFKRIMTLLRNFSGVDFIQYKSGTLKRRITRRMALSKVQTMDQYIDILEKDSKELESLHQDILIRVTRFFRDPETFEAFTKDIFPSITKNKTFQTPLRIWVPGCSTGEEVYSIAISLLEYLGDTGSQAPFQIFGTDLNDRCVSVARAGIYLETITADVSKERLKRFFIKTEAGYQIIKTIREQCVFSKQNVCIDPPFSKVDLISCRNLLIYLGPDLQKRFFLFSITP